MERFRPDILDCPRVRQDAWPKDPSRIIFNFRIGSGYPMMTQSPDTSPEVERKWIELLRTQTPRQRLETVVRLNRNARALQIAGIRLRHPDADEYEIRLRVASQTLDRETMVRLFDWDPELQGYG